MDGGGQAAQENADISISVVGPDDSPPVFYQQQYTFTVDENTPRFHFIGTTTAANADPSRLPFICVLTFMRYH